MAGNDVSVLPIPVPEPPAPGGVEPELEPHVSTTRSRSIAREATLRLVSESTRFIATDVEFTVEAIEEVHIEEVRFEEVEVDSVESVEPAFEPEVSVLDEEDIDDLDS